MTTGPDRDPGAQDVRAALCIARALAAEAIWDGDRCTFQGATAALEPGTPASWRGFDGDLYEGTSGVARFLGHAAALAGDDALARTALGALDHALARTEGFGLLTGLLGPGLVALELAELLDRSVLVGPAVEAVERASAAAAAAGADAPCDLMAGLAGVVVGLAAALDYDVDGGWRVRAFDIGRTLAAVAHAAGAGWSWPMAPSDPQHLCGFAHGASGVALAFGALATLAPHEPGWAAAAAEARLFERAHFSAAACSWADLRRDPRGGAEANGGVSYPHMWCHGSVGIGHERLTAHRADPSCPLIAADLAAALAAARAAADRVVAGPAGPGAGFEVNGSQCHGLAGLADLLVEAGDLERARRLTAFMRSDAARPEGWRCGIPTGETAPGLMIGRAGIGWAMLRTAHPDVVPRAALPAPLAGARLAPAAAGVAP